MLGRIEALLARFLLGSRWLMAPLCLGLVAALVIVLVEFFRELAQAVVGFFTLHRAGLLLVFLKLVDLVLVANWVLLILAAAAEFFVPNEPAAGTMRPG